MAIKRVISTGGCCGGTKNNKIILYLDKTVTANVIPIFEKANLEIPDGQEKWVIPSHYTKSGILYLRKDGLTCNGSFGTTKLTVTCGPHNRDVKLEEFEKLLETALNS